MKSVSKAAIQAVALVTTLALASGLSSSATAGSLSGADTYAADIAGIALPPGTVVVLDYIGYRHGVDFVTPGNNKVGGKVDIYTNIARVDYITRLFDRPVVFSAALPYADIKNASIAGVRQTSTAEFFNPVLFTTLGLVSQPQNQRFLGLTNYTYLTFDGYDNFKQLYPATPNQTVDVIQLSYAEGLGKLSPRLNGFWVDVIANASFHSDGANPLVVATPLAAVPLYSKVKQDDSYDIKGFLRYNYNPLGYVAVGLEKSWGGRQTYSGGVAGSALGPLDVSKDDFLKGHLQAAVPLANDFQVALDLTHDFERVGGFKEDFTAELRFAKLFSPAPGAAAGPLK